MVVEKEAPAPSGGILIADDDPANVRLLKRTLTSAGLSNLRTTTDSREVLPLCKEMVPDLILLDLHMPYVDGLEVTEQVRTQFASEEYLPILMLTGDATEATKKRALVSGVTDFLTKPFSLTEAVLRVENLLSVRRLYLRLEEQTRTLEVRVVERTRELEEARLDVLERLTQAVEFRDDATGQHTRRVGQNSARIAEAMGLAADEVELIRRAAPLHDAGKVAIPDSILLKPGPLTGAEFEVIKTHATIGARILTGGDTLLMQTAEAIALSHHEQWDGNGYPRGISGDEIPLAAQIVSVADVFDALSHARPYREAWPVERVNEEIRSGVGSKFSPDVVDGFLSIDPII